MVDERYSGLRRQLERLGERLVAGWKVGLTSGRGRDSMGVGFRPFGFILNDRCFQSGDSIGLVDVPNAEVETELCFRFKTDLCPNASKDDVLGSIAGVAPAFEIIQLRLGPEATLGDRLADGLSHWGIVVGLERTLDWRHFDFNGLAVTLKRNGMEVESVAAAGHMDDHFRSIAAMSSTLAKFDRQILTGNRVITGSYTRQPVGGVGIWQGDFGEDLGVVEVEFA